MYKDFSISHTSLISVKLTETLGLRSADPHFLSKTFGGKNICGKIEKRVHNVKEIGIWIPS